MNEFLFLKGNVESAARRLLGCEIEREIGGKKLRAKITEVEAYDETDEASHSFRGKTERNSVMFGPSGRLYVYFTYGMYFCANIVSGETGQGAAILLRAAEPILGLEVMIQNRGGKRGSELVNGPAKLCQAFQIDKTLNGHNLKTAPLRLIVNPELPANRIIATPRIGISKATHELRRFLIKT